MENDGNRWEMKKNEKKKEKEKKENFVNINLKYT